MIIKVMAGLERMVYPNLFLDAPSGVYVETMPVTTHPFIHAILLQSQKSSTISASPVYLLQYVDRLLLSATSWAGIRLILIVSFSPNADTDFDLSSRTRRLYAGVYGLEFQSPRRRGCWANGRLGADDCNVITVELRHQHRHRNAPASCRLCVHMNILGPQRVLVHRVQTPGLNYPGLVMQDQNPTSICTKESLEFQFAFQFDPLLCPWGGCEDGLSDTVRHSPIPLPLAS